MQYNLVVHLDDVRYETRNMNGTDASRERALHALSSIEEIVDEPNTLQILKGTDPRRIPLQIREGDSVTLYGAYHGSCLSSTQIALQLMNVKAEYHPEGFI